MYNALSSSFLHHFKLSKFNLLTNRTFYKLSTSKNMILLKWCLQKNLEVYLSNLEKILCVIIPANIKQYLKLPSVIFTRNIKITSRYLNMSEETWLKDYFAFSAVVITELIFMNVLLTKTNGSKKVYYLSILIFLD